MNITESGLEFRFNSDAHQCIKFDVQRAYKNVSEQVEYTKGIDILSVYHDETLFLIEVKNFAEKGRGSSKIRNRSKELIREVAQKFRDSCALIIHGSRDATHDSDLWQQAAKILVDGNKGVRIVLWVELNVPNEKQLKKRLSDLNQDLKRKLKWLSPRLLVTSTGITNGVQDIQVKKTGQ